MLFPELRQLLKRFVPDSGEPIALNLKTVGPEFGLMREAQWYMQNGYPQIAAILSGGMPAWSGESVSRESALSHSVVWACNRIISESVGFLPAVMMQETSAGKRAATEHPMYRAMKNAPNEETTAQSFRETLTSHCLMEGGGFAKIIRRSGASKTAIALEQLLPAQVKTSREKQGQKRLVYEILDQNGRTEATYIVEPGKPHDILHLRGLGWDGVRGYSVIEKGRNSIGSALAAEKNIALLWANGGRVPYHIEHPTRFKNDDDFKNFRKDWRQVYAEPHNAPILENGMVLKQDGMSMQDAQGIENRAYTVAEICRWFSISPHLAQDLSHATFSNIEHLALEFVKHTLGPWLVRHEQEFYRCVLTPEEKNQGYYLKHNVNALLRGDLETRMTAFATMLQNGIANIDEVRDLEDWNPLPNGAGEGYHIQLNMGSVGKDGQVQAPQGIVRLGSSA